MATIKCGNCRLTHSSVAEVQACYANGKPATTERTTRPAAKAPDDADERARRYKEAVAEVNGESERLSPRQSRYLGDLLGQLSLELDDEWFQKSDGQTYTTLTIPRAHGKLILDSLISAREAKAHGAVYRLPAGVVALPPKRGRKATDERTPTAPRAKYPSVPAGHYALRSRTGNNDLDFYRVDRPTEGQWAGRTFVKRVVGGGYDGQKWYPVRGAEARETLEEILAVGIDAAGNLYADELKRCRRCNRDLTDDESRARRYGPDCWEYLHGGRALYGRRDGPAKVTA